MKIRLNLPIISTILGLFVLQSTSCSTKRFSEKFINRYITDTNWLYQLNYVPACSFTLQSGKREVDFSNKVGGHYIFRKREIDEFIFTKVSTGVLQQKTGDTLWVQFAEEANSQLRFVRNQEEDVYYLFPDTIIDERHVIVYKGKACISKKKNIQIPLNVQGLEITKVNRNRMIQKGIKPKGEFKYDATKE